MKKTWIALLLALCMMTALGAASACCTSPSGMDEAQTMEETCPCMMDGKGVDGCPCVSDKCGKDCLCMDGIEKFIERLGERFNIREIAFDRWGAVQMVQNLEGMGFTVVPFGQGFKDMSPPTKELMKLVLEERIAHGGHPVLRWMMDNIYIRTDPAGNIKPDKEKSTEKIDGAVATVMALDRAIRCGNDTSESVYDSRGLLFI